MGTMQNVRLFRNSPWSQDTGACPPTSVAQGGGDRHCSPTSISPKCSLEEALKGNPHRQCPSRQRPGGAEANTRQESRSSASWSGNGPRGGKITLTSSSTVTATNHDGTKTSVVTSAYVPPPWVLQSQWNPAGFSWKLSDTWGRRCQPAGTILHQAILRV